MKKQIFPLLSSINNFTYYYIIGIYPLSMFSSNLLISFFISFFFIIFFYFLLEYFFFLFTYFIFISIFYTFSFTSIFSLKAQSKSQADQKIPKRNQEEAKNLFYDQMSFPFFPLILSKSINLAWKKRKDQ